ncbi:MAG: iron ABC transporter permease [Marinilabiliaceae bacterium]|nr:iron ABC transporter permease [Marinilabiliaceae bacterium]
MKWKFKSKIWSITLLISILTILVIMNLAFGSVIIPISEILDIFFSPETAKVNYTNILFKTRLPQTITAMLAGSGLAVSGLQLQTLFRNPLADPSILGISSGSGLGVAIVIMLTGSISGFLYSSFGFIGQLTITIAAFTGASLVLLIILNFARKINSNAVLLIIGIMIGYAAGACIDILKFFSPKEEVYAFIIWGMGSFSNVSVNQLSFFIPVIFIGLFWSLLMIKPLNIMYLGDNYSSNLGLNVKLTRILILANTGLLTAVIAAYCGPIAFIGLAVPHLTRGLLKSSNHGVLIPGVIFAGASLSLICNLASRMPAFDGTLPLNSVTSIIGAPVVIWVLLRKNKEVFS